MKLSPLVLFLLSSFCLFAPPSFAQSSDQGRFKITQSTLSHLQRAELTPALLQNLQPLLNQVYAPKSFFLKTLRGLDPAPNEKEEANILEYAVMDQLRIKADEFLGSMKDGAMDFRNNVVGRIPRENVDFLAQKLRLFSREEKRYQKMIGDGKVEIRQWDRNLKTDYALYQNIKLPDNKSIPANPEAPKQNLLLEGNISFASLQGKFRSHLLRADLLQHHVTMEGKGKKRRIWIEVYPDRLSQDFYSSGASKTFSETPQAPEPKITVQAFRATLDDAKRRAVFEGDVEMTREDIYMQGGRVIFNFNENQKLTLTRAEQNVCLQQTGRIARADSAVVDDVKQLIILTGHAEVDTDQYKLRGDKIHLFLDVNKGTARGNNKAPIEVIIAMDGNATNAATFSCKTQTKQALP